MRFNGSSVPGGAAGGDLGGLFPNPTIVGDVLTSPTDATTRARYVSAAGSDTTGDGLTEGTAWRTVEYAIAQAPDVFVAELTSVTTVVYQVRVIPPYTGGIGTIMFPMIKLRSPGGSAQAVVQVIAWPTGGVFGATNDPRWSYLLGPVTPTAAAQYSGNRLLYTLPAATLSTNDQHAGEFVRIFNSGGTEVCRGWIFRSVAGATQQIYIHTRQTYTATVTDQIYICRPDVVLGTPTTSFITGSIGEGQPTSRIFLEFNCCRLIDNIQVGGSIAITLTNTQAVANGGSGGFSTQSQQALIAGSVTTTFVQGVPTAEDTLRQHPCFFRSAAGGFLGSGNFYLGGCVWLGQYRPTGFAAPRATLQLGNCTFRGDITPDRVPVSIYSFATTTTPLLFIPTATNPTIVVNIGSDLIFDASSFVAVETSLSAGDFVRIRNGGRALLAATLRPVTPATPMAAGRIVTVSNNGSCMINTASTLAGAGANNDVQAGANAAVSLATLAGATPNTDAANQATVYAGSTL